MNKVRETMTHARNEAIKHLNKTGPQKKIRNMVIGYGLLCFVVLCFFIYLNTIDTEAYEQQLRDYVHDKYNGTLELGSTSWSVLPVPSFDIGATSIKNNQGETLLEFDSAKFKLAITPLFDGIIDIRTVAISNPKLHLNNEKSTSNWQQLYKHPDQFKESFFLDMVDQFKDANFDKLPFENLDIENGTVYQKHQYYTASIKEIDFELDGLVPGQPADFEATGHLHIDIHHENMPEMKASFLATALQSMDILESELDLVGKLRLQNNIFQFAQVHLGGELRGLYKKSVPFIVSSQGHYNVRVGELLIDPIDMRLGEGHIISSVKVETTNRRETELVITLPKQTPRIGRLIKPWVTSTPSNDHLIDLLHSLEVGGHFISTDNSMGFQLKPFNINAHPGQVDIALNKKTGHIVSAVNLSYIDTRPVLDPVEGDRRVSLSKETIDSMPELKDMPGLMDDLTQPQAPKLGDIYLPRKALQNLAMDLELKIGTFVHPSYEIRSLSAYVNADNGIITLKPMDFIAFNGNVSLNARLDTNQSPMLLDLHQSSERINIGDMMERTTHHRWVTGLFDNKIDVSSTGKTVNDLIENATGTLDIRMREASIPGANFHRIAYDNIDALRGILPSSRRGAVEKDPALKTKGTTLDDFFANFTISKESISSDRALVRLNNRPVNSQINYFRSSGLLQLVAPIQLRSFDDVMSSIVWPVTCRIKNWGLPRCGINPRNVREQAQNLLDGTQKTGDQQRFDDALQEIQGRKY